MNITDYLINKSKGLLTLTDEVSSHPGTTGIVYKQFNSGSTEVEVSEYLYALVKLLKPDNILETGCYSGISAMYMGQALKENGRGSITTLEIDISHIERAAKLWRTVGVDEQIAAILTPSLDYQPAKDYQLFFLDSELHLRFHELAKFYPYLKQGGYVLIHDMPKGLCQGNVAPDHPDFKSWPVGDIPQEISNLVKEDKLRPMHFPNPRSMIGLYKTQEDEYKW